MGEVNPAAKKGMVQLPELQPFRWSDPGAPQTNGIKAADGIVAARDCEGRQVFADG